MTEPAAKADVKIHNSSATEPLAILRHFRPEVNSNAPKIGV